MEVSDAEAMWWPFVAALPAFVQLIRPVQGYNSSQTRIQSMYFRTGLKDVLASFVLVTL
jgi:hypothetical protein